MMFAYPNIGLTQEMVPPVFLPSFSLRRICTTSCSNPQLFPPPHEFVCMHRFWFLLEEFTLGVGCCFLVLRHAHAFWPTYNRLLRLAIFISAKFTLQSTFSFHLISLSLSHSTFKFPPPLSPVSLAPSLKYKK